METNGHFTMRGGVLVMLALLLGVAGFLFEVPALLHFCLLSLLIVALSSVWVVVNLRGLELVVDAPARVEVGKVFQLGVKLENKRSFMDSMQVCVQLELEPGNEVAVTARWLATGGLVELTGVDASVRLAKRGCVMSMRYRMVSSFPFGLFRRECWGVHVLSSPMLVLPRKIVPRELLAQGALASSESEGGANLEGVLGDVRGLRPWRNGDSVKQIHWAASARSLARGHDLRVREYDPPGRYVDHCSIVFHSYGQGGAMIREDRFERAMGFLAGCVDYLYGLGIRCTLHADFLGWNPQQCAGRKEVAEVTALLAEAQRATGTESHEVSSVCDGIASGCLIVVSDLELEAWSEVLELAEVDGCICVDIKQVRYRKNAVQSYGRDWRGGAGG